MFLHNKNQTETHLVLMSTAIKMAQLMGLSRIPDEFENSEKQGNIVEREVRLNLFVSNCPVKKLTSYSLEEGYGIHWFFKIHSTLLQVHTAMQSIQIKWVFI